MAWVFWPLFAFGFRVHHDEIGYIDGAAMSWTGSSLHLNECRKVHTYTHGQLLIIVTETHINTHQIKLICIAFAREACQG